MEKAVSFMPKKISLCMRKRFVTSKNLNSSGADQAYFLYFLQKGNEHPPKQVRGIMLEKYSLNLWLPYVLH